MFKRTACIVLFAIACGIAAGAAEFELKLGHNAAPDNPRHTVAREFARAVAERSGGRIAIEVHHSESIGSDSQMAEALMLGRLDLSINSQGAMAGYIENLNVLGLPFLFASLEQAHAVLDGPIGRELAAPLERKNMKILAYWENGFRHITNNIRPIDVPADVRGLRIRTPSDKLTVAIFEALGAEATPFAFGKLRDALEQGLFDGQENPLTNIYYSRLHEVQKFLSLTGHKYECCPLVVSMRTWRMLPADLRTVLQQAAAEFAVRHREETNRTNEEILAKLSELDIDVNQADVGALREACRGVYRQFESAFGRKLMERVIAAGK